MMMKMVVVVVVVVVTRSHLIRILLRRLSHANQSRMTFPAVVVDAVAGRRATGRLSSLTSQIITISSSCWGTLRSRTTMQSLESEVQLSAKGSLCGILLLGSHLIANQTSHFSNISSISLFGIF